MIQALNNINIKPASAKGMTEAQIVGTDVETIVEGADFANELMASLSADQAVSNHEVPVNPELSEQLHPNLIKPTKLASKEEINLAINESKIVPEYKINTPEVTLDTFDMSANEVPMGSKEGLNPKAFDQSLTNGVDKIIQPKADALPAQNLSVQNQVPVELTNEQVLKLAQGQPVNVETETEMTQAMLRTPQFQQTPGRPQAMEVSQGEVNSQLMNLDDFVAQKNLVSKKSVNNAYGFMPKENAVKVGTDTGLKSHQVVSELKGAEASSGSGTQSVNSQQFILNSQIDLGASAQTNAQSNEAQSVKSFNMSHIKTEDSNQIMNQITDYIVQAKAAKEPTVNMRVNHEELGIIDITVNKQTVGQDALAINIGTHSADGKNFFQANSKDLFTHLTNSGINVSDLKIETPSQTSKNDFDFGGQSNRGGFNQEKQFGSEQNQRRHDSERRQSLWDLLHDKDAA